MAELDTIYIKNPLNEVFPIRFNGEEYKLEAGEEKLLAHMLARHFAKHISDKICAEAFTKMKQTAEKKKEAIPDSRKTMMVMYDNPQRRIALYDCLHSKEEVEKTIKAFPQFKASETKFNFIGEMKVYDDYVESVIKERAKEDEDSDSLPEVKTPQGK